MSPEKSFTVVTDGKSFDGNLRIKGDCFQRTAAQWLVLSTEMQQSLRDVLNRFSNDDEVKNDDWILERDGNKNNLLRKCHVPDQRIEIPEEDIHKWYAGKTPYLVENDQDHLPVFVGKPSEEPVLVANLTTEQLSKLKFILEDGNNK